MPYYYEKDPMKICDYIKDMVKFSPRNAVSTQQKIRDFDMMLAQCWASVVDGGPTLSQHWYNMCLSGRLVF